MPILYMSREGRQMLAELEGSRANVYLDVAGFATIGVGHMLTKDELSSGKIMIDSTLTRYGGGLSADQIDSLLTQDLTRFEDIVGTALRHRHRITAGGFDALVSLAFNIGGSAFRRSTLVKKIIAGDLDSVPDQFRRWIYAGGKVQPGLKRRREVEIVRWSSV